LALEQVRALFAQEAQERLSHLAHLLLELELADSDSIIVDAIFRDLHTLKGSAAIAGLDEVSVSAHALEDLVEDLRAGRRPVTREAVDTLLAGTDQLAAMILGEPPGPVPVGSLGLMTSDRPRDDEKASSADSAEREPEPAATINGDPPSTPAPGSERGTVMVSMDRLDELVRLVGQTATAHLRLGRMLNDRFGLDPASQTEFSELSRSLNELQDRAMRTQMVPVASVTDRLHRAVRDLARAQDKDIRWEVRGGDTELDRGVLSRLADSLLHLVRNAADHGIESPAQRKAAGKPGYGTIRLHAMQLGSEVIIAVTDDGPGIDLESVRHQSTRQGIETDGLADEELLQLVFRPGLSTTTFVTDVSGRGVGLDVVRTNVEAARGRVEVRSTPGAGSEFRIVVPITLAVLQCLLVETGGQRFALPFHRVVVSLDPEPAGRTHAEGRPVVLVDGQAVPLSSLAETVGVERGAADAGPIVVLADTSHRHAFQVGLVVGQRDVVLKGLSRLLPPLPAIAGASVEPDGTVLVVLDPPGLIQRARRSGIAAISTRSSALPAATRRRILVVDDALMVRELQRSILERAGFDVRLANDGSQALSKLAEEPSDLVLTDVEMPVMDGFALTEAIRGRPSLANIPVLILSSRASETDRQRGLDAGADGYIIKSSFDEGSLLSAVNRLIGARP
jgi:two-component system chemotaxis sensor kinase CheA